MENEMTIEQPKTNVVSQAALTKALKKSYGVACRGFLYQILGITGIAGIIGVIMMIVMVAKSAAGGSLDMDAVMENYMTTLNENMMVINAIAYVIVNLTVAFIITKRNKFKLRENFKKPNISPLLVIGATITVFFIQFVDVFLITWFNETTGVNTGIEMSMGDNAFVFIVTVVYVVLLGPITEEIFCRGAAMNSFAGTNGVFAILASSLLFGMMHGNFAQMFNAGLMGLVFAYLALKSKSIYPAMICHILANAHAFAIDFIINAGTLVTVIYGCVIGIIAITTVVLVIKKKLLITSEDKIITSNVVKPQLPLKLAFKTLVSSVWFWLDVVVFTGMALFTALSPVLMAALK